MAKDIQSVIAVRGGFQLKRVPIAKTESTHQVSKHATVIFDTAGNDRNGVSNKTIAAHPTGIYIPQGAIITKMYMQVKTAFTSATNAGTVAISAQSANDMYTATAVSGALGSTGFIQGIEDGTTTHFLSLTAEREIVFTNAVEALTAGKLIIFVDYIYGL